MNKNWQVLLLTVFVLFSGCQQAVKKEKLDYDKPLAPGEDALVKVTGASRMPDFTLGSIDVLGLGQAIDNSLNYMSKPSSKKFFPINGITHQRVVASLKAFKELLNSGLRGEELNQAIKQKFDVYMSVGYDRKGTVLFTGYYTPIFDGSKQRTEKFKYPLYTPPDNLKVNDTGRVLGREMPDGSLEPYPSRAVIEQANLLEGNELVWLSNPFEVYVCQVQGSAKIELTDGSMMGVGYAASNGREYRSISKQMVREGIFTEDELSLKNMIEYFDRHPEQVKDYTYLNPRYIFFQIQDGRPRGSLNEPVIPMRSIATDKDIFPRASLTFISTYLPLEIAGDIKQVSYKGFALDQDAGGAIRAPGRCDVYMGIGDQAGRRAGQTRREGNLYYLFLKEDQNIDNYVKQ